MHIKVKEMVTLRIEEDASSFVSSFPYKILFKGGLNSLENYERT